MHRAKKIVDTASSVKKNIADMADGVIKSKYDTNSDTSATSTEDEKAGKS
jgi:hypothetical protein